MGEPGDHEGVIHPLLFQEIGIWISGHACHELRAIPRCLLHAHELRVPEEHQRGLDAGGMVVALFERLHHRRRQFPEGDHGDGDSLELRIEALEVLRRFVGGTRVLAAPVPQQQDQIAEPLEDERVADLHQVQGEKLWADVDRAGEEAAGEGVHHRWGDEAAGLFRCPCRQLHGVMDIDADWQVVPVLLHAADGEDDRLRLLQGLADLLDRHV